jgi:glycosyltransferase involved in cell wall biosynthesis
MIVKNEEAVIARCLESARPLADCWLIIDTGSTDATKEVITETMAGLPGELLSSKWRDFGTNRTELVRAARKSADWLLLLDADMVLDHDDGWQDNLRRDDVDAFLLDVVSHGQTYGMPYLVRAGLPWRYEGVTHEFITADRPVKRERLSGLRIRHHADGGSRADKFERDRRLLEEYLASHPDDPRTVFYLAQTYRDLGETARAVELYRRRAELGGWEEESFYALYQVGRLLITDDWPAACEALLSAYAMRPSRAEPLYQLARGFRERRQYAPAYLFANQGLAQPRPEDVLFVETFVYDWGLRFERSVSAWYVGRRDECRSDSEQLARMELPEVWRTAVEGNLALFK